MALAVFNPVTDSIGRLTSSIGVTFSATPSNGEIIVLILTLIDGAATTNSSSQAPTVPSGFILAKTQGAGVGTNGIARRAEIYTKLAASEAGVTYTFTGFGVTASNYCKKIAFGCRLTGYTGTHTIESTNGGANQTGGTTFSPGNVTPTSANSILVAAIVGQGVNGSYSSWSNSFIEKGDNFSIGSGPDGTSAFATKILTVAATDGTTGTAAFSQSSYVGAIVAIADVPAAGGKLLKQMHQQYWR